ncbi:cupredoxin domain-containing protein [Halalkalicoccus salilacus]|uniref:cupredoxin domain-containing protein n=1 Tax=Halalkalicoccus TaxID=332246 RepID=UPI002F966998
MLEEEINVEGLDLSDAELITVLKNHRLSRRVLMKAVGVGTGAAMLGGTAAGQEGRGNRIHDVFGAPYAADENVPSGLVDYVVDLDILPGEAGQHAGFPDPDDETPEFVFEPVGLHVEPGSVVNFRNVSVEHTATAFHEKWSNPELEFPTRVPDGVPGFTSPPYVADESWLYRFTTKGVYDLLCFPHLGLGM